MMGPATYQGHGWLIQSTIPFMPAKVFFNPTLPRHPSHTPAVSNCLRAPKPFWFWRQANTTNRETALERVASTHEHDEPAHANPDGQHAPFPRHHAGRRLSEEEQQRMGVGKMLPPGFAMARTPHQGRGGLPIAQHVGTVDTDRRKTSLAASHGEGRSQA